MTHKKQKPHSQSASSEERQSRTSLRQLRLPPHKLLRLRRVRHPVQLPSVWQLSKKTSLLMWRHRAILLGIMGVYALLSIVFVHGLSSSAAEVQSLRQQLNTSVSGGVTQIVTGASAFSAVFAGANSSATAAAGVYQILLGLVISLAAIWTLRQVTAGERVRLRDAFYKSTAPLIPFILVLTVLLIQLLPMLIGGGLYSLTIRYGIAVNLLERCIWGALFAVLTGVSAYMLCSSLFAVYIVTLPDMTPLRALRNARQLVRYRRLAVLRKLIFLPIALGLIAVVIMLPVVLTIAIVAQWVFFALGIIGLVIVHAYLYTLYRELLV